MISCQQRAADRARTIPQFEAIGLSVTPFVDACDPPSTDKNKWNAERAVRAALEADCGLLLIEDDIDLAPDFMPALQAALRDGGVVTFWLEKPYLHPPEYQRIIARPDAVKAPVGLYPVSTFGRWYGTQCILIPHTELVAIAASPTFGVPTGAPFDRWVRQHLRGMKVALPNPVQHRSPPTLVDPNRIPRISPTFHLQRDGRWEEVQA